MISRELIAHGLPGDTPVALVQQGTTQDQKVYIESLDSLPELAASGTLKPPTIIIVGQLVSLHAKLSWFGLNK